MKKQFYKFSALILAAVCGAAALSACGAKPAENTQTTAAAVTEAATDAATDAATEAVQTTEEPTRAADEFVRTVRVESWETKYGDETREYFCQQPELLIQSADADAINAEIAERCNKIFDAYDSGKPMEDFSKGAEYKAYLNGKTLSLVFIDRAPVNQSVYYYVYNIDVESGSRLDDAELIARSGNDASWRKESRSTSTQRLPRCRAAWIRLLRSAVKRRSATSISARRSITSPTATRSARYLPTTG